MLQDKITTTCILNDQNGSASRTQNLRLRIPIARSTIECKAKCLMLNNSIAFSGGLIELNSFK